MNIEAPFLPENIEWRDDPTRSFGEKLSTHLVYQISDGGFETLCEKKEVLDDNYLYPKTVIARRDINSQLGLSRTIERTVGRVRLFPSIDDTPNPEIQFARQSCKLSKGVDVDVQTRGRYSIRHVQTFEINYFLDKPDMLKVTTSLEEPSFLSSIVYIAGKPRILTLRQKRSPQKINELEEQEHVYWKRKRSENLKTLIAHFLDEDDSKPIIPTFLPEANLDEKSPEEIAYLKAGLEDELIRKNEARLELWGDEIYAKVVGDVGMEAFRLTSSYRGLTITDEQRRKFGEQLEKAMFDQLPNNYHKLNEDQRRRFIGNLGQMTLVHLLSRYYRRLQTLEEFGLQIKLGDSQVSYDLGVNYETNIEKRISQPEFNDRCIYDNSRLILSTDPYLYKASFDVYMPSRHSSPERTIIPKGRVRRRIIRFDFDRQPPSPEIIKAAQSIDNSVWPTAFNSFSVRVTYPRRLF